MLVLTRKQGEGIIVGDNVKISVVEVRGSSIRLGIDAPRHLKIHRLEVYERIKNETLLATRWAPSDLNELLNAFKISTNKDQS